MENSFKPHPSTFPSASFLAAESKWLESDCKEGAMRKIDGLLESGCFVLSMAHDRARFARGGCAAAMSTGQNV
jgi:hypothetical protein